MSVILRDFDSRTRAAVAHYWATLERQASKQRAGDADRGGRAAVTGGKQMDGFCRFVRDVIRENGLSDFEIFTQTKLQLPGFFRPTKRWDLVVVSRGMLVAAVEFKSQAGSFGNNFYNRVEEAIGVGKDMETALREGAFGRQPLPWLGWLMLLERSPRSTTPVSVDEPHFKVFPEFRRTSYADRYQILLRKLVREKLFNGAALLLSTRAEGVRGSFHEPAPDLTMKQFLAGLAGHVAAFAAAAR